MKIAIFCLSAFTALAVQAQSKSVTLTIPEQKIEIEVNAAFSPDTQFSVNFDGSVNVKNPKLLYDGRYISVYTGISSSTPDSHYISESGICATLGKNFVSTSGGRKISYPEEYMTLKKNGSFDRAAVLGVNYVGTVITQVTCK